MKHIEHNYNVNYQDIVSLRRLDVLLMIANGMSERVWGRSLMESEAADKVDRERTERWERESGLVPRVRINMVQ